MEFLGYCLKIDHENYLSQKKHHIIITGPKMDELTGGRRKFLNEVILCTKYY